MRTVTFGWLAENIKQMQPALDLQPQLTPDGFLLLGSYYNEPLQVDLEGRPLTECVAAWLNKAFDTQLTLAGPVADSPLVCSITDWFTITQQAPYWWEPGTLSELLLQGLLGRVLTVTLTADSSWKPSENASRARLWYQGWLDGTAISPLLKGSPPTNTNPDYQDGYQKGLCDRRATASYVLTKFHLGPDDYGIL